MRQFSGHFEFLMFWKNKTKRESRRLILLPKGVELLLPNDGEEYVQVKLNVESRVFNGMPLRTPLSSTPGQ